MNFFNGYLPLVIRGVQMSFSIVALSMDADHLYHFYYYYYIKLGLAVTASASVWYLLTATPFCKFIPPIASIMIELLLAVGWILLFGLLLPDWQHENCGLRRVNGNRGYYFDEWSVLCKMRKVSISFYFISFVFQLLVLVLLSVYSIYPAIVNKTLLSFNYFSLGTIYPRRALTVKSETQLDEEKTDSLNADTGSKDGLENSSSIQIVAQ